MKNSSALCDGYIIREAVDKDAGILRAFGTQLLEETEFFLRGPEERAADDAEMAGVIRTFARAPDAAMLNCWTVARDGKASAPVGEAVMIPGRLARTHHTATVGVGVLRDHWGLGLAKALMHQIEAAAQAANMRRLELTVFAPNERAQRLYEGLGYRQEGIKRRSIALPAHGVVDEIMMAKLFDS